MTPEQCIEESDKVQNAISISGGMEPDFRREMLAASDSRALWEIAAQLSRLNQHTEYILKAYSPNVIVKTLGTVL